MVYRLILLIFLILPVNVKADDLNKWVGHWKGLCDLTYDGPIPKKQKIEMDLIINHENETTYSWVATYQGQPSRKYELIKSETTPNTWVLDEKNGIFIDKFHEPEKETISSLYSVNGRYFSSLEKILGNKMFFESRAFLIEGAKKSGVENTDIVVGSHQRSIVQTCELEKQITPQ